MVRYLVIVAMLAVLTGVACAQPTDYGKCVAQNKQFGGATAACAEEICDWQVCIDQVMYRTGTTSTSTESPLSYTKDPGSGGSAVATCKPKEQIMKMCQARNKVVAPKPEEKPKPAWCRTGSDTDLPALRAKAEAMKQDYLRTKQALKPLREQLQSHRDARKAAKEAIAPERAAFNADKARAKSDKDYVDTYKSKWVYSGRLKRLNDLIDAYNEQNKLAKELWPDVDRLQKQLKTQGDRYKYFAKTLMDDNRDCAGGMAY